MFFLCIEFFIFAVYGNFCLYEILTNHYLSSIKNIDFARVIVLQSYMIMFQLYFVLSFTNFIYRKIINRNNNNNNRNNNRMEENLEEMLVNDNTVLSSLTATVNQSL